jgi:hypothetical protein
MRFDMDEDVEITRRSAVHTPTALALQAQARAIIDAGGNLNMDMTFGHHPSFALAGRTGGGDGDPLTTTLGTGGAHGQKSLRA